MQFSTIVLALAGATTAIASAIPAKSALMDRQAPVAVCTGAGTSAQCCAVNVLDLADLNCAPPPTEPTSVADFESICAAEGQQAQCCDIPILGQALICNPPV